MRGFVAQGGVVGGGEVVTKFTCREYSSASDRKVSGTANDRDV